MNENEIMNLIAEEGFIKSPKKVRQKVSSTIEEYIDDFEDLISKIRMKHDKCLPLARTVGSTISDETIDKSKKDLEKILRRYRSLTIEKLEELQDQVDEIKNPLKAEDRGKEIIEKADELHDERYPEIKEFLDKYKPVWVKELASEAVDEPASDESTDSPNDGLTLSTEQAQKLTDRIAAIKQAKPQFEKAKRNVLADYKRKLTNAVNAKDLNGYIAGLKESIEKNTRSKSSGTSEEHVKRQGDTKRALAAITERYDYLMKYEEKIVKALTAIINSLSYQEYYKETKKVAPASEGAKEVLSSNPAMKQGEISSWIRKRCDVELPNNDLPIFSECISKINDIRADIKQMWTNGGSKLKDEATAHYDKYENEKSEAEKAAAKKKEEATKVYNEKVQSEWEKLTKKVADKEMTQKEAMIAFKKKNQELRLASSTESFVNAEESVTGLDAAFFVGGAFIGSMLFNGLIAKKEDVTDKSIPGAKAYRYLLNDNFVKAEKMMKKMVSSNKTFEVNKTVAREIMDFKKEYYRPVAYSINKFLDFYDKAKPELFKEKKYYFETPNTVRDEAIYKKISLWRAELYAALSNEMGEKAKEVEKYSPAYDLGTDCEVIRVGGKFLDDILNVDKTFAVLKEIEGALKDLPDPLQIRLYNEHTRALNYYHLPVNTKATREDEATSPLHAYIMYEYDIAEKMKRLRDTFVQYLSVVYDILNYTRYIDTKNSLI